MAGMDTSPWRRRWLADASSSCCIACSGHTGEHRVHGINAGFPFPPQWHFDLLRGLEHFAAIRAPVDDRLADAFDVITQRRLADGRWPLHRGYAGREWFRMEELGPSRWATLRCLRVLRWRDVSSQ